MDNNLSQSIIQPSLSSSSLNTGSEGFFDSLKKINATTWLLIIIILAFLGFNIFVYLGKITQEFTNIFSPIVNKLFGTTIAVTGQVVDVSAEGAKAVVGGTAGAIETGLTAVQNVTPNVTPNSAPSAVKGEPVNQQKIDMLPQSSLNKALDNSKQQQSSYEAHEASSSLGATSGKSGWCYVGDDRGFRTCAQVGVNDTCMSGDIFPSQEICMNPNLRA